MYIYICKHTTKQKKNARTGKIVYRLSNVDGLT